MSLNLSNTVHQIWLQGYAHMSKKYQRYSDEYRRLNNNNYILWDEHAIKQLISDEYPQLSEEYDGYQFWIMRVDLAKYIILEKYGGFYVDMDTKPLKSFIPLINDLPTFYYKNFNWILRRFIRKDYINNNFLYFPTAHHPLAKLIIERAAGSHIRNFYDFKVLYIVENIGPHFLMRVIDEYKVNNKNNKNKILKVISDYEMESYFHDEEAKSWVGLNTLSFDGHDAFVLAAVLVFVMLLFFVFKFKNTV